MLDDCFSIFWIDVSISYARLLDTDGRVMHAYVFAGKRGVSMMIMITLDDDGRVIASLQVRLRIEGKIGELLTELQGCAERMTAEEKER